MITKKTWIEFKESGLLWFANSILHMFGWAIVVEMGDNGEITDAYPARVQYRGFSEERNTNGYIQVSEYLKKNINELLKEAKE